jgi:ribonuclease P protein subunit RPR2
MKNESLVRRTALFRMRRLLALAEERTVKNTPDSRRLAKRYAGIAERISTHYKVKMPKALDSKVCRKCGNFLVPGINCNVRLASSHGYVAYACECGNEVHVHYRVRRSGGA